MCVRRFVRVGGIAERIKFTGCASSINVLYGIITVVYLGCGEETSHHPRPLHKHAVGPRISALASFGMGNVGNALRRFLGWQ